MPETSLPILDRDHRLHHGMARCFGVLNQPSAGLTTLLGDSAALPRVYRPADDERDFAGLNVAARYRV